MKLPLAGDAWLVWWCGNQWLLSTLVTHLWLCHGVWLGSFISEQSLGALVGCQAIQRSQICLPEKGRFVSGSNHTWALGRWNGQVRMCYFTEDDPPYMAAWISSVLHMALLFVCVCMCVPLVICSVEINEGHPNENKQRLCIQSLL